MDKKTLINRFQEMFKFAVAGGTSFLVDFGILVFLVEVFSVNDILAAGISFTVSVIVNYIMCIIWVFDAADKKNAFTIIVFVVSSVIGLGLNEFFMWLFIYCMHINYMVSKVIATLLVMVWNYIAKRQAVVMQNNKNTG